MQYYYSSKLIYAKYFHKICKHSADSCINAFKFMANRGEKERERGGGGNLNSFINKQNDAVKGSNKCILFLQQQLR